MPKEKKVAPSKAGMDKPEKIVHDYLVQQNRPYSVTDIVSNLHQAVTKTECQKALQSLVDKNQVESKTYGKQIIFVINQANIDSVSSDQLKTINLDIRQLQEKLVNIKAENQKMKADLASKSQTLTADQLCAKIEPLRSKVESLQSRLHQLQSGSGGTTTVSVKDQQKTIKEMETNVKIWKQRRRMFKDMFDALAENMSGKPKDLLEELGVDTVDHLKLDVTAKDLINEVS